MFTNINIPQNTDKSAMTSDKEHNLLNNILHYLVKNIKLLKNLKDLQMLKNICLIIYNL